MQIGDISILLKVLHDMDLTQVQFPDPGFDLFPVTHYHDQQRLVDPLLVPPILSMGMS